MKYQTLRKIAIENGLPFKARSENGIEFTCTGISPRGIAVGWGGAGYSITGWSADQPSWTPIDSKSVRVLKEHLYSYKGMVHCGWFTEEEFNDIDGELIEILRRIEITTE